MVKDKKEKQRKLTPAEERRLSEYEKQCEEYARQGYQKTELTVGIVEANVFAILAGIPLIAAALLVFHKVHPGYDWLEGLHMGTLGFLAVLVVLIVVHELIHGLTWGFFSENHWKDIEFGFMVEYLTPYCACTRPLTKGKYILGALMPLIVLGMIPMITGVVIGSGRWLVMGIIMTLSAGGDILIVINLMKYKNLSKDVVYMDHPTQAGGVVFEKALKNEP